MKIMDTEGLISEILRSRPELKRTEVLRRATKKREDIPHISDYTAVLLVAVDLGVKISLDAHTSTVIGSLVDGLSDVSIKGRVLWINGPKEFRRKDGSTGSFTRAGIGDATGTCNVIFWDRSQKELEDLGFVEGNVVKLSSATRKSLTGVVELHVRANNPIEAVDVNDEEIYPSTRSYLTPLSQITTENNYINTFGQVMDSPLTTEFTTEGGRKGIVSRFRITDGKVVRGIVFWDDLKDYKWVKSGTGITIFNGKTKIGRDGEIEIHIGKTSNISPFGGVTEAFTPSSSSLKDLIDGYNASMTFLRIGSVGFSRTSSTNKPTISLFVSDSTGEATLTLIGATDKIKGIRPGDIIAISKFRSTKRGGELYLLCDENTNVELKPNITTSVDIPEIDSDFVELGEITIFNKLVNVTGVLVKPPAEEPSQIPNLPPVGEFFMEERGRPARVRYRGSIKNYTSQKLEVGKNIRIYGAYVNAPEFLSTEHYLPLKLRAYSRIEGD